MPNASGVAGRHRTVRCYPPRTRAAPSSSACPNPGLCGGPGRYAITLAQRGYSVTLFDLSPDLFSMARQRAADAGVVLMGLDQGTATDLTRYPDAKFDAVLLMGPLYHLLDGDDRRKAQRRPTVSPNQRASSSLPSSPATRLTSMRSPGIPTYRPPIRGSWPNISRSRHPACCPPGLMASWLSQPTSRILTRSALCANRLVST